MVVHDLNAMRAISALCPFKTYPPLLIDADAVLPSAIADQGLQMIAGQMRKVLQVLRGLKNAQSLFRLMVEAFERGDPLPFRKAPGSAVPIASDHFPNLNNGTRYVKRISRFSMGGDFGKTGTKVRRG